MNWNAFRTFMIIPKYFKYILRLIEMENDEMR
jgi:hypothetical protein